MRMLIPAMAFLSIWALNSLSAQERAAGGPMETQMTWSALSGQISTLKTQLDAANLRMGKFETCGKKGMLYAPGHAGIDADACLAATTPPSKVDAATFTEKLNGYVSPNYKMPNPNAYCVSKGYDISYAGALTKVTSSHHCGGSSGGVCDYTDITGYTISCLRNIAQ